MNCQDISRIADTGSFSHLPEAQRRTAEAHALTCRHCAPVWAAHVRLAELRIPAMPGELPARFRTLAAVPVQARGRAGLRRLTVVGGVVVLAAAAAMLAFHFRDGRAPQDSQAGAMVPSVTELPLAPAALQPEGAASVVADDATSPAVPEKDAAVAAQPDESLPLLLPPDNSGPERAVDLALQKVADSHPELVGSEVDGIFTVTMLTRANGTLVSSDVRLIPPGPAAEELYRKARAEQSQAIADAGSRRLTMRARNSTLPDGRSLSAEVRLQLGVVPDNYDMTRSRARVLATVRQQHADLALPATAGETNRLTILLAEDGSIQRKVVEKRSRLSLAQDSSALPMQGGNPDAAGRFTENLVQEIAGRLALGVEEIGEVGVATLEVGDFFVVVDESGNSRATDNRRVLNVAYAWPRRAGESSSAFALAGPHATGGPSLQSKFDVAAALTILKRKMPDAFIVKAADAGTPGLFLNHKGELIRAGRVRGPGSGEAADTVLIQQLAPGVKLGASMGTTIEDGAGGSTRVVFAWEENPQGAANR
jgi:hypothetical protein